MPFNYSWPFAVLQANEATLTLTIKLLFYRRVYSFSKLIIVRIVAHSELWSDGIRIEHTDASQPRFMAFWFFKRSGLIAKLRALGYPVQADQAE